MGDDATPKESLSSPNSVSTKLITDGGGCNYWWFLAIISFFVCAAGFITVGVVMTMVPDNVYVYGIVIDAGSTHSSLYVYKWLGSKTNGTAEVVQVNKCKSQALSDFENHPLDAGNSLQTCLTKAKTWIPSQEQSSTEVYLGATAGMRLINASNPKASEAIFYTVRQTISSYPFNFLDPARQARILTGDEEGTFSWITVNYFAGTLGVKPLLSASPTPVTHGALDMGGASTQITFTAKQLPKEYEYQTKLYGVNHTVYTHSFLCYGINEALRRFQAHLVQSQVATNDTVLNPCGPIGDAEVVPHDLVFEAPCTKGPRALEAFGSEIIPKDNTQSNYTFVGESDPEKCQSVTEDLFNFTQCSYRHCSFNGAFLPPLTGDFYAFSSFFYQVQFLNLTNGNDTFSLEEFQTAVIELCNSTWNEVKTMETSYPTALPWYCFETNFVLAILTKGYGFNKTNWESLHFKEKVNGNDLGWALGFMINSSNRIPVQTPEDPFSTLALVLLLILFTVFLVTAVGFACIAVKVRKDRTRGYENLGSFGTLS